MRILVDADACPVVSIVERTAKNMRFRLFSYVIQTMSYIPITVK